MSSVNSSYTTPTGMTGAGGGNMLRITGMATGLDVDAMVKKMMAAEQARLDKAKQNQQVIQWRQEAYHDIIKDIKDLQSSFFDSADSTKNILSPTNFLPFTVNGADTSVTTFTPLVGAQAGKYTIHVTNTASGAGISNSLSGKTLSTKLSDIIGDTSLNTTITLNLNSNGTTSNITLINTDGTKTIGDLVNAINNQSSGAVKASFSELTGTFKLNTAATGDSTSLTIKTGTTANLSSLLGFSTANDGSLTTADWTISSTNTNPDVISGATALKGANALVDITPPGDSIVSGISQASNNFTIDGMDYSLAGPGDTSVTVGVDTQKVYDKLKDFVDKYNTIIDKIQTKLTEKKDSSYQPITDAQKASMSESQITSWETKAKVGILRNDSNLQNLLNDLRTAFTTGVKDTGIFIGRYGDNASYIDTSKDYDKPGHIDLVDETKVKDIISKNPDQLVKLLTNISTTKDDSSYDPNNNKYLEDGVFTRINRILQTNVGFTNTTLNSAILTSYANQQYDYSSTGTGGKNTLPDQLYEQQLFVKKITDEMSTKQEKYYMQFSQLETAINQLNTQQSMLSSMLGG